MMAATVAEKLRKVLVLLLDPCHNAQSLHNFRNCKQLILLHVQPEHKWEKFNVLAHVLENHRQH